MKRTNKNLTEGKIGAQLLNLTWPMTPGMLGMLMIIFLGQNISRQKFKRIFTALNYAEKFSLSRGILVYVVLLFFGSRIASVFTDDPVVIDVAQKYFYIIGASYGFQGLVMLSTASFNGINKPYPSAVFSLIRMLVLYVPLAWLGAKILEVEGVFWAGFIANVLIGLVSFCYLKQTIVKIGKR